MAVEHASIEPRRRGPHETPLFAPVTLEQAPNDQRRWGVLLSLQFAVLAASLTALFASGSGWLILPALLAMPIAASLTVVYLAMSSDTNGRTTI